MIMIENRSKATKVLKALGRVDIRLFPGFNNVNISEDELMIYLDSNSARGMVKECLRVDVDKANLSEQELKQVQLAKEKNDAMNKAQQTIKKQNELLAKGGAVTKEQNETLKKQGEIIEAQTKMLEDLKKEIEEIKNKGKGKR